MSNKYKSMVEFNQEYLKEVPMQQVTSIEPVLRLIALDLAYLCDVFAESSGVKMRNEDDLK